MTQRLLAIGEAMIEMAAGATPDAWRMGFAGDTLNTAWYARRFLDPSWAVSYFTALGTDRYSNALKQFIAGSGIATDQIITIPERQPGLYFIHQENGDRQFTYWRDRSAAKLLARDKSVLREVLQSADLIYFSGITLAVVDDDRERLLSEIARRRHDGATICFDPNIRPRLWQSAEQSRHWLTEAGKVADIVLPTFGDDAALFGDRDPQATATRYAALGAREIVVKNGDQPALLVCDGTTAEVASAGIEAVVDATGAGDSFNGAYLAARSNGAAPREAAQFAHRVAAVCLGHHGALAPQSALDRL